MGIERGADVSERVSSIAFERVAVRSPRFQWLRQPFVFMVFLNSPWV